MRLRTVLIMVVVLVALGVVFYFVRPQPEPPPAEPPKTFIWSFDMVELQRIGISLPRQGKSQVWAKHEDQAFYFDEPGGPKVDRSRWAGGVPLLLSGPAASRIIAEQATDRQLQEFGLIDPSMRIDLVLDNGLTLRIEIGDSTPDRRGYYIRRAESKHVYSVDYTWYDVMERLVLDPPYPKPEAG